MTGHHVYVMFLYLLVADSRQTLQTRLDKLTSDGYECYDGYDGDGDGGRCNSGDCQSVFYRRERRSTDSSPRCNISVLTFFARCWYIYHVFCGIIYIYYTYMAEV